MSEEEPSLQEEIRKFVDREVKELGKVLENQDPTVVSILRFHLLTEYMLERLIVAKLVRGDRVVERGRLPYRQKLVLVHSFDCVPDRVIAG